MQKVGSFNTTENPEILIVVRLSVRLSVSSGVGFIGRLHEFLVQLLIWGEVYINVYLFLLNRQTTNNFYLIEGIVNANRGFNQTTENPMILIVRVSLRASVRELGRGLYRLIAWVSHAAVNGQNNWQRVQSNFKPNSCI